MQLLDVYFRKNEQYAIKLLKYELENWGKTTNLSLAVRSDHTQFVAHPCSQKLLTDIWNGQMTFQTKQSLKVNLFFKFFAGCNDSCTVHVIIVGLPYLQHYANVIA